MFLEINSLAVLCLILGMVLVGIEIYTPGLGVSGILGLLLLVLSVVLQAKSVMEALILSVGIILFTGVMVIIIIRSVAKGRLSKSKIILRDRADKEEGFTAVDDFEDMVGKEGITLTPLRPAGTVQVEGENLDVVSDTDFINAQEKVIITAAHGRRIVVRKIEGDV